MLRLLITYILYYMLEDGDIDPNVELFKEKLGVTKSDSNIVKVWSACMLQRYETGEIFG